MPAITLKDVSLKLTDFIRVITESLGELSKQIEVNRNNDDAISHRISKIEKDIKLYSESLADEQKKNTLKISTVKQELQMDIDNNKKAASSSGNKLERKIKNILTSLEDRLGKRIAKLDEKIRNINVKIEKTNNSYNDHGDKLQNALNSFDTFVSPIIDKRRQHMKDHGKMLEIGRYYYANHKKGGMDKAPGYSKALHDRWKQNSTEQERQEFMATFIH